MGIVLSQRTEVFHVPYGPWINDGTLENTFIDIKANPALIPVLPPCIGWPETQALLHTINTTTSPLMSLAADQHFSQGKQDDQPMTLVSFVTLCFAEMALNQKEKIHALAEYLQNTMDSLLQDISNSQQQPLHLEVVLEIQPTVFHHHKFQGWSLTVCISGVGQEPHAIRGDWGWGIQALIDALTHYNPAFKDA